MWHFFSRSKVQGRVQSTVESRYPHMELLLCPASLHSLLIRSLVSKLSGSPSLVFKLYRSPSLVCKLSRSPSLVSKLSRLPLLAASLLPEFAEYLVSGRPSAAAAAAYICGELFNSSQRLFKSSDRSLSTENCPNLSTDMMFINVIHICPSYLYTLKYNPFLTQFLLYWENLIIVPVLTTSFDATKIDHSWVFLISEESCNQNLSTS